MNPSVYRSLCRLLVLLTVQHLPAKPQLTVVWESFDVQFLDHLGQPLTEGAPGKNTDGAAIQLGYFTGATKQDPFAGEWRPLVLHSSIGDSEDLSGLGDGYFSFTTFFTDGSPSVPVFDPRRKGSYTSRAIHPVTTSLPSPGQYLAIRFHDSSWEGMQRYNTLSSPTWQWTQLSEFDFGGLSIYADFLDTSEAFFEDPSNPYKASLPLQGAWDYCSYPAAGDWNSLFWFGHYYPSPSSQWVFHELLGWVYPSGDRPGDIWFYQPGLGWLWSGAGCFPLLWSNKDQDWLYVGEYRGASWIYHYNNNIWETTP
jgi:hypothetical protein